MKTQKIGTLEAKTRFSELLSQVEQGRRFCITKHGRPIAELVPIRSRRKSRKAGFAKGTFLYAAPDFDASLDDFKNYTE